MKITTKLYDYPERHVTLCDVCEKEIENGGLESFNGYIGVYGADICYACVGRKDTDAILKSKLAKENMSPEQLAALAKEAHNEPDI